MSENVAWLAATAAVLNEVLVECFNYTQQQWTDHDAKRVYILSPVFTLGKRIDKILFDLGLYEAFKGALAEMG